MQLAFRILDISARLLMGLGAGCLLLAAYLLSRTLTFSGESVQTTGEVVGYHETRDGDDTRYRPRVRFRTPTGDIITVSGQMAATSKRFAIAERVPVIYARAKPTEARLASFTDNWLGPIVAGIVGLVALAGGILIRRGARRSAATGA